MNFLYLSTLAWDEAGGAHNPTQMARALARRGAQVLFVEPQPSRTRETDGLPITVVALTELGMTPVQLRRAWFGLDSGDLDAVARNLLACAPDTGTSAARTAVYSAPFDPFVRLAPCLRARGWNIAYYAMDDFGAAPRLGYTQFAPGAQDYIVRTSDLLLAVTPHGARALERAAGGRVAAQVLPNGIDRAARLPSALPPPTLARGELTLGFWGTVMESLLDAELIAHVAAARPQWTIHLLGAIDPEPHRASVAARLQAYPNVVMHGAVSHAELPRYARAFDVALAPFPDSDFTRGRDPIKVYEYLAAHLPVAASYTPQLETVPYVQVAYTPAEYLAAIQAAAQHKPDARRVDEYLAAQSWDARAAALLELANALPPRAMQPGAGAVVPSLAQPDLAAVLRYAQALEHEIAQLEGWARELEKLAARRGGLERIKQFFNRMPDRTQARAEPPTQRPEPAREPRVTND